MSEYLKGPWVVYGFFVMRRQGVEVGSYAHYESFATLEEARRHVKKLHDQSTPDSRYSHNRIENRLTGEWVTK